MIYCYLLPTHLTTSATTTTSLPVLKSENSRFLINMHLRVISDVMPQWDVIIIRYALLDVQNRNILVEKKEIAYSVAAARFI